MESRLEYLREYNENIEIIAFDDINKIEPQFIPNTWHELFLEKDSKKRIEFIMSIWKKHVGVELRNTISYLSEFLIDVELLKSNDKYSILYTLKTSDEEEFYYEGGNPLDLFKNKVLEEYWSKIPSSIRKFYENVHNGFFYHVSKAMGLVSLDSVTYFDNDEWGIIEDLEEPLQIDLKTTFGFFKSGMGGYVAIDYNNCKNDNATLWWVNKPPRYDINFWDVVDEWIVIGFQS
ncbi:MAG: SMI1/KNR4 family protein [Bacillota bacterium]|nr:SMI1/KNR4 family protein [Bacillota bacterium]